MLFGFEIDPQVIITSVSPILGRIVLILAVSAIVQKIASRAISKTLKIATVQHKKEEKEEFQQRIDTISSVFIATSGVVIWGLTGFVILSELGIDITPFLTGAGIAGLAIGFGAQNLVRDIISGMFILLENQYTKGDVVRIGEVVGEVESINLRKTVLRDLDGVVHHVPNGEIKVASNLTQEYSKININIEVSYETNLDQVTKVLNKIGVDLANDKEFGPMITEAPKFLRVDKFATNGIELKIIGTTKPIKQWEVMGELRKRILETFEKEGIEIPYPHRTIVQEKPN